MKNIALRMLTTLVLVTLLGSLSLKAQEWTPIQQEVWKNINNYWALISKGDIDGYQEYVHKDYIGWDYGSPLPETKEEAIKWLQFEAPFNKTLIYEIKPVTIKVYGEFAIVNYYYSYMNEWDGEKNWEQGRWTDIMLKQGNKWVLIADHGGKKK